MYYLSLFSGIGTGEKGIEQAFSVRQVQQADGNDGICRNAESNGCDGESDLRFAQCIGFSEIDRHAEAIYRYHYPDHRNYGDATRIVPSELPDFDFLIAGFPCQSFSIAGKRLGFEDTRGTLFFEIARILRDKRPAHFLLENVAGLLSHDNGNTFRVIVSTLTEMGYDTEWNVINSKDHGVPQNRERVFIIGHPRNGGCGEVFSVGDGDGISDEGGESEPFAGEYSTAITSNYRKGVHSGGETYAIGTMRTHKDGQGFREVQSGNCPTIPARAREDGSGQPVIAIPVLTPDRETKRQNGRRFKEDGDPAFTLTAQDRHGDAVSDKRIRRLTPIEAERLQGLPDQYTAFGRYGDEIKEVSDTQRYKGLGNAFTVNVIEAIITRMLEKGCIE